jgi:hypothetical protein
MATNRDHKAKDATEASDIQTPTPSRMGRRRSEFIDIDNPLRGVDLDAAVKRFASNTGLEDLTQVLLRGAYLAEDSDNYPNVEGLTATDRAALKREDEETRSFRILARVPKQLRTIIIMCCVAAVAQYVYTFQTRFKLHTAII